MNAADKPQPAGRVCRINCPAFLADTRSESRAAHPGGARGTVDFSRSDSSRPSRQSRPGSCRGTVDFAVPYGEDFVHYCKGLEI